MEEPQNDFSLVFGWNEFFESQCPDLVSVVGDSQAARETWFAAKIICEERNRYRVQSSIEEAFWVTLSGKMLSSASTRIDYPAVGDWVLVDRAQNSDHGFVHKILKRKTIVYRKQNLSDDIQILSTNVDFAFIVSSLNADLNYRRFERYLTIAQDAGVTPVILLTKADIYIGDRDEAILSLQNEVRGIAIHAVSKDSFQSSNVLAEYLRKGTASVFIGSSGVGKSTLVNFLIGDGQIRTQDIQKGKGMGRHTTTSRNLYVSRYGGLIIDTPGMRELQLSDHSHGVEAQFSDIEELIHKCRFGDCRHKTEPGCAVKQALKENVISPKRWESFQKLQTETEAATLKQSKDTAAREQRAWKKVKYGPRSTGRPGKDD